MAKDTFYFSHDYNSRNDVKIKKLLAKHGMLGYGVFWAVIEELYNNANALPTDYDTISFDLRIDKNVLQSVINDFDFFVFNGDFFGSTSVQKRLEERNAKSVKARKSAFNRWNKNKENANALQPHYECNAIKERKEKEIKEKDKNKELFDFVPSEFLEVFYEWMDYKNSRREGYKTKQSKKLFLDRLIKMSDNNPNIAKQIIERSISNNWAGVFDLEKPKTSKDKKSKFKEEGNQW